MDTHPALVHGAVWHMCTACPMTALSLVSQMQVAASICQVIALSARRPEASLALFMFTSNAASYREECDAIVGNARDGPLW